MAPSHASTYNCLSNHNWSAAGTFLPRSFVFIAENYPFLAKYAILDNNSLRVRKVIHFEIFCRDWITFRRAGTIEEKRNQEYNNRRILTTFTYT